MSVLIISKKYANLGLKSLPQIEIYRKMFFTKKILFLPIYISYIPIYTFLVDQANYVVA